MAKPQIVAGIKTFNGGRAMAFKMLVGDSDKKATESYSWIALVSKGVINSGGKRRQDVKDSQGSDRPWTSLSSPRNVKLEKMVNIHSRRHQGKSCHLGRVRFCLRQKQKEYSGETLSDVKKSFRSGSI